MYTHKVPLKETRQQQQNKPEKIIYEKQKKTEGVDKKEKLIQG